VAVSDRSEDIKLGLNCVGGSSAGLVLKMLGTNAKLVTYGGMSKKPLMVPATSLIFNNVSCMGFWVTEWARSRGRRERQEMLREVTGLVASGRISFRCRKVPFDDFPGALQQALEFREKILLTF